MSHKITFAIIILVVILLAGLLFFGQFIRNLHLSDELNSVEYDTAFERVGIGESNFRIPGVRGGLRVRGDLIISGDFKLKTFKSIDLIQHVEPQKDVLSKDYYKLWQLQTPFWLEKNANSDTVYVYCGADTLFVLLSEIP